MAPCSMAVVDVYKRQGLEVVAAAVAPHQGHGRVAVGVDQAGHQNLSAAPVDDLGEIACGGAGGHLLNLSVLHDQVGVLQNLTVPVHGDDGKVKMCIRDSY